MSMIHDEELRQLFQTECEEHLQKLEQGFLHLEKNPTDGEMLVELQRELHNIKGSSRMLGVTEMESVSHRMEDVLKMISRGEMTLTPELVDRLELGLDALQKMANEALTGILAGVTVTEALAIFATESLTLPITKPVVIASVVVEPVAVIASEFDTLTQDGATEEISAELTPPPNPMYAADAEPIMDTELAMDATEIEVDPEPTPIPTKPFIIGRELATAPLPAQELTSIQSKTPAQAPTHIRVQVHPRPEAEHIASQNDSIRVDPKKLDVLMSRAGELMVTKTHIERWLTQIETLISLWEDVGQDMKKRGFGEDSTNHMNQIGATLHPLRQAVFEDSSTLNRITQGLESDIRALRLLPMDRVFRLFPRTVRDLSRSLAKEVELIIQGGDTTVDKQLIEMLKDPLMHLIRNAIDHGIESPQERMQSGKPATANVTLRAHRTAADVVVEVEDDGKGLDIDAIKKTAVDRGVLTLDEATAMSQQRLQALIFAAGFSTNQTISDISGRGVGLDVVRADVERFKGTITVESTPGRGCKFLIKLPLTLATTRVFIITLAERRYAIPVEFVRVVRYVSLDDIFLVQDQETISWHGDAISMAWLEDLLELPKSRLGLAQRPDGTARKQPCLLLETNEDRLGVFVDEIVEELEIVLKPAGPLLTRVRNVSGVTILGSGEVCVVLNAFDLIRSAQKRAGGGVSLGKSTVQANISPSDIGHMVKKPVILLAEDSLTTRTQEKRILESAGYEVVTAVDGLAAFHALAARAFDAIISDIEMPQMDGLTLTSKVRENKAYEHLPIILVTSLASDADRKRGMDVGADAYIAKSAFNQQVLIETLNRLV